MKGVLIGADLLKLENEVKLLEINTDVDLFGSDISYLELGGLFSYLVDNGYTKLVLIYKTIYVASEILTSFENKCAENNITFQKIIIPNNSITIPSIQEEANTFYFRCAYDSTAIIDDVYCRDKSEVVKLLFESNNSDILPKTFVKYSGDDEEFDNLTTLSDNGTHPNIIIKKILPDFYKTRFPEFLNLNSTESLETNKLGLSSGLMMQDFQYNQTGLQDGQICDVIRVWILLLQDAETMIDLGGHLTKNPLPLDASVITYTDDVLDNKWRSMYFSNPKVITKGVPSDYDVIKIVDGVETITNLYDISVGDVVKSVKLLGLDQNESLEYKNNWSATGSLSDIIEYTTASVVNKSSVDYAGWLTQITYTSGSITGTTTLTKNEAIFIQDSIDGTFKFKSVVDLTPTDLMVASSDTIASIVTNENVWFSGSISTLNIEPDDVFVAGSDLNQINTSTIGAIVHNYKGCSWCCFDENTMVAMNGEDKHIKDVVIGDMVYSLNFETGEKELKEVYDKVSPVQTDMVEVKLTNGTINLNTTDHPYYNTLGEMVSYRPDLTKKWHYGDVGQLSVGDILITFDGLTTTVESLTEINMETNTHTIYVKDNHNFYANGVLVYDEKKQ
jgi:hypothetical protein